MTDPGGQRLQCAVGRRARTLLAAILLSVCVLHPVAEMFDDVDPPIEDGNEIIGTLIVVLCIGMALVGVNALVRLIRRPSSPTRSAALCCQVERLLELLVVPVPACRPPTLLLRV